MSRYSVVRGVGRDKEKWYLMIGSQRLGGPYKSQEEGWAAAEFWESKQENPQPIDDKPKFH